jgi:large subunit ribosomal protein L29
MRASEVRDLSDQELAVRERELRESVFRLRLRKGMNQLDNPASLKNARRDIARIKTVLAERVLSARSE